MKHLYDPCKDMEWQLSGYLDNSLSSSERQQVEQHIDECEACRGFLDNLNDLGLRLRAEADVVFAPMNFEAGVWQQISSLRSVEQESRLLWLSLSASAGLAILVIAGMVSPVGALVLDILRLSGHLLGYGWMFVSHMVQGQFSVVAWVAVAGGLLVVLAGSALHWLSRQPSWGRS